MTSLSPKVLIVARTNSWTSHRIEVHLWQRLHERGIPLEVVTNERSRHAVSLEQAGIKVHYRHPGRKISPDSIRWLRQLIREEGFNILHLYNSRAISNGVWAAMGLEVKVVTYRGSGDLHWYDPTAYLTHLHPRVDRISCLSHYVKRQVDAQFPGMQTKTLVHHKAFLPEWFEDVKPTDLTAFGIPQNAVTGACAANYRKVKGIEYLLKATSFLAHHPDFHLLLIGQGLDHPNLLRLAEQSPMKDRIHLAGFREDIYECVKACDFYIQPSLKEGLSKSVIEAMAQDLPCIVSNVGGLPELIEDQHSGFLVPAKDPEALAGAISKMILHPDLRRQMGSNARLSLFTRFSMQRYVEAIAAMYHQLLEEQRPSL